MKKLLKNIHPGEILLKDFLDPIGISPRQLARESGIPYTTVIGLLEEKMPITPEIAMKLSNFFGTSVNTKSIS